MDHEIEMAHLEGILDEIKTRSKASETRKKHMSYFIEGMRAEAKEMATSARSLEMIGVYHSLFPNFLKPFRSVIKHRVSVSVGKNASSAKGLYDSLNRFLQAAYLPEEEIIKREREISCSDKDTAAAFGEAYSLKMISRIAASGDNNMKQIASRVNEISRGTGIVSILRNASEHGHKHALIEGKSNQDQGFVLSEGMIKKEELSERQKSVEVMADIVTNSYLDWTNSFLSEYLQISPDLKQLTSLEKTKLFTKKAMYKTSWVSKFLGKYMVAPLAVITLGLGVIGGCLNHGASLYNSQKHNDEQTRRQLVELSNFKSQVMSADKKAHDLCDITDYLAREQAVLMSYTNRPADFDYQKVSKTLQRLKKASGTLKVE